MHTQTEDVDRPDSSTSNNNHISATTATTTAASAPSAAAAADSASATSAATAETAETAAIGSRAAGTDDDSSATGTSTAEAAAAAAAAAATAAGTNGSPTAGGTDADAEHEEPSDLGLPNGWSLQVAPNGRIFFIDHILRKTSWVDPRTGRASPMPNQGRKPDDDLGALPEGWEERVHSDGRIFFIDHSKSANRLEAWCIVMTNNPLCCSEIVYGASYFSKVLSICLIILYERGIINNLKLYLVCRLGFIFWNGQLCEFTLRVRVSIIPTHFVGLSSPLFVTRVTS